MLLLKDFGMHMAAYAPSLASDGHIEDSCVLQTVDAGGKQVGNATRKRTRDSIAKAGDAAVLQVSTLLSSGNP